MKHLLILIFTFTTFNLFSQEVNENGRQLMRSFRVSIEGQDPKGYEISNNKILFKVKHITDLYFTIDIHNQSEKMASLDYSESYYAVDGTTSRVIPGETYLKDINSEVVNDKIAPGTKINKSLYSPEFNMLRPIFSNKRANRAYKAGEPRAIERLVLVVKVGEETITQSFNFQVIGTNELKVIEKKKK